MSRIKANSTYTGVLKMFLTCSVLGIAEFAAAQSSEVPRRSKEPPNAATRNERDRDRNRNFRPQDVRAPDIGLWFDAGTEGALLVSDVALRSAMSKLGVREGDRIVSVDGHPVIKEADFVDYLFADQVRSGQIEIVVLRGDTKQLIKASPSELIEEYYTVEDDPTEQFGVVIDDQITDRIVVTKVVPRSPAFYAGIRAGDVITRFRGEKITPSDFNLVIQKALLGPIEVTVQRGNRTRQLRVEKMTVARATDRASSSNAGPTNLREERPILPAPSR